MLLAVVDLVHLLFATSQADEVCLPCYPRVSELCLQCCDAVAWLTGSMFGQFIAGRHDLTWGISTELHPLNVD